MKKIIFLVSVVFVSLTLSSCWYLFPTTIEYVEFQASNEAMEILQNDSEFSDKLYEDFGVTIAIYPTYIPRSYPVPLDMQDMIDAKVALFTLAVEGMEPGGLTIKVDQSISTLEIKAE